MNYYTDVDPGSRNSPYMYIQIRIREFFIRIQGKRSYFNFFQQNLRKKNQFQILIAMQ